MLGIEMTLINKTLKICNGCKCFDNLDVPKYRNTHGLSKCFMFYVLLSVYHVPGLI